MAPPAEDPRESPTSELRTSPSQQDNSSYPEHLQQSRSVREKPVQETDRSSPRKPLWRRLAELWVSKTGIDWPTYKQLFKGAITPTIAVAAFQGNSWAEYYTTLGYLVGIASIIGQVIQPRAKFIQMVLTNVLVLCFGAAVEMLALFCVIKARENTEARPGNGPTSGLASGTSNYTVAYNSSASAVAAIWLFVQIFTISAIRAKRPQLMIPSIFWAILTNVSMTYGPQFADIASAESFLEKLLIALLSGLGLATGVSLFIFPLTSRSLVFKQYVGYGRGVQSLLRANIAYIHTLETADMFASTRINTAGEELPNNPEAEAIKEKTRALTAAHAKLATDLPFAKREIAMGKLGPDDLQDVFRMLRQTMIPVLGLSQLSEFFHRIAENRGWDTTVSRTGSVTADPSDPGVKARFNSIQQYHELMTAVRTPFDNIGRVSEQGIEHALLQLELIPKSKVKRDLEDKGDEPGPGDRNFSLFLNRNVQDFVESKTVLVRRWAELHGIQLSEDFFEHPFDAPYTGPEWLKQDFDATEQGAYRRQLYICLYMEFLLTATARRVQALVKFADELRASGKLDKHRLVVPGYKRLRKWIKVMWYHAEDKHDDDHSGISDDNMNVYMGEALRHRRDPAHQPPVNFWERYSDKLRAIPRFFASPAAAFGLRVACANMSIAVINFLRPTQVFFTHQRLFWAMIMISIGMQPSAGQGLRMFFLRVLGTAIAVILSYVAWYIVDSQAAGVLVFFFIFLHGGVYILLKKPQWTTIGMVTQITMNIILGYGLDAQKIGKARAASNGQEYYPTYLLGAIRLATVAGGLFVGYIWTVFPYPISEHQQIRNKIGSALYLMANFYSIMHETVQTRLRGGEGDMQSKGSPGRRLEKARIKVFSKTTLLMQSLNAQLGFVKYDVPIGGKFPLKRYKDIAACLYSIQNNMQLVSFASSAFTEASTLAPKSSGAEWVYNFNRVVGEAKVTSQSVTTMLILLSSAITSGQPLPPYIRVPEPYMMSRRLDELDHELLSIRHIAEPGYASFAVIQIGTKRIIDDLKELLENIKELVGELDFSYHIISTADPDAGQSEETLTYTATRPDDTNGEKRKPE